MDIDPVKIDTVKILVDDAEIKDVQIGGRSGIFEHDDVEHFTEERDGKIVQIEGELYYESQFFDFQVGYNENLGRLKVRKKGQANGEIDLVYNAYDFLFDLYKEYFIEI